MKNKIVEIRYFICLAILLEFNLLCQNFCIAEESSISGQLIKNNYYKNTANIENLLKERLSSDKNSIVYTKVPRGLILSVDSSIFFDEGKSDLLETSKPLLHSIAEVLKILNIKCIIETNTDVQDWKKSDYNSNWELSIICADKIVDYFIQVEKINPQKISALGFGEFIPFRGELDNKQKFKRRIDFVIINYEKYRPLN